MSTFTAPAATNQIVENERVISYASKIYLYHPTANTNWTTMLEISGTAGVLEFLRNESATNVGYVRLTVDGVIIAPDAFLTANINSPLNKLVDDTLTNVSNAPDGSQLFLKPVFFDDSLKIEWRRSSSIDQFLMHGLYRTFKI